MDNVSASYEKVLPITDLSRSVLRVIADARNPWDYYGDARTVSQAVERLRRKGYIRAEPKFPLVLSVYGAAYVREATEIDTRRDELVNDLVEIGLDGLAMLVADHFLSIGEKVETILDSSDEEELRTFFDRWCSRHPDEAPRYRRKFWLERLPPEPEKEALPPPAIPASRVPRFGPGPSPEMKALLETAKLSKNERRRRRLGIK